MSRACIIQPHQSLTELYASLLRQKRDIEREIEQGRDTCKKCGLPHEKHVDGGHRCNSHNIESFIPVRADERKNVERAIRLVEELMDIQ